MVLLGMNCFISRGGRGCGIAWDELFQFPGVGYGVAWGEFFQFPGVGEAVVLLLPNIGPLRKTYGNIF